MLRRSSLRTLTTGLSLAAAAMLAAPGVHAQGPGEFATHAKQAVLMDFATGAVLFQHNADDLVPPGNMTKLMTLEVAFRLIKAGQLDPQTVFTMSENAWKKGGATSGNWAMFVPINEKVTVGELLQGIVVQAGNDAAIGLGEAIAGSEEAFAKLMEEEARRIGVKKSTFRNATGIDDPRHLMTVREIAMVARAIIKDYPDQYALFAQKEFQYRKHKFFNRNPLVNVVQGADGLGVDGVKFGRAKDTIGYGLVGSAVQEGRRLIVVVRGLESENARRDEAKKLLEWGFRTFTEFKVFDSDEVVGSARVWGGDRMYVPLAGKGEVQILLPRSAGQRLRGEIVYNSPLKAPISKGDEVAALRVTSSSGATNEVPLYATEDVARGGMMRRGLDSLLHLALGWIML